MIKIIRVRDYEELSERAAEILISQVREKKNSVLGLATGATPLGTYEKVVKKHNSQETDFSGIYTANLDEYKGIEKKNPDSYYFYMRANLFDYINIKPDHILFLNGMAKDAAAECRRYEKAIAAAGGIDLQLLGIGVNGHIGFNEPSDVFEKETHPVELAESTRQVNARFLRHTEVPPKEALTMGIGTIFSAEKILLLASGPSKADCLRKALYGPITPHVPASVLQLHRKVVILADAEALELCGLEKDEIYL